MPEKALSTFELVIGRDCAALKINGSNLNSKLKF